MLLLVLCMGLVNLPIYAADFPPFSTSQATSLTLVTSFLEADHIVPPVQLKKHLDARGYPPLIFPRELLEILINSENLAKQIKQTKLKIHEIPRILDLALKYLREKQKSPDPLVIFSFLNALRNCYPSSIDATNDTLESFQLMARAVMDAPYMADMDNSLKKRQGSFSYAALMASYFDALITTINTGNNLHTPVDYWQKYFNEDIYPTQAVPWLEALYYFYEQEGEWLRARLLSTDADWLKELEGKLKKVDLFYNDGDGEALVHDYQEWLRAESSPLAYEESLQKWMRTSYLVTDKDIYWRLLPLLEAQPEELQMRYFNLMLEAGASPFTLIDTRGATPLIMAQRHNLNYMVNAINNLTDTISNTGIKPNLFIDKHATIQPKNLKKETSLLKKRSLSNLDIENIPNGAKLDNKKRKIKNPVEQKAGRFNGGTSMRFKIGNKRFTGPLRQVGKEFGENKGIVLQKIELPMQVNAIEALLCDESLVDL